MNITLLQIAIATLMATGLGFCSQHIDKQQKHIVAPPTQQQKDEIKKYLDKLKENQKPVATGPVSPQNTMSKVVQITAPNGSFGSGSFISADGDIVTAAHVGKLFTSVEPRIHLTNGQVLTGTVVNISQECDMSLIKVKGVTQAPFFKIEQKKLVPGQSATILGYSGGVLAPKPVKFISYQRSIGTFGNDDMLFTPGIQPGDSGGPIINEAKDQVGIGVAKDMINGNSIGVSIGHCVDLLRTTAP